MDWGFVLRAIAAVATPLAKDKLQRNEIVIQILKNLGFIA
jgi:hypothetical protein